MNPKKNTVYVVASSILLGLGVIFFSLAITQYQVLTNSKATGSNTFNQCDASGSNKPCGSCSVTDFTIGADGKGTAQIGCQLLINESDSNLYGSYAVKDHSWFWCNATAGSSCTQGQDVKGNVNDTSTVVGTLILSSGNTNATNNGMTWNFTIPNWTNCGRVQVDSQIAAPGVNVAGLTKPFGDNCAVPPTNTPGPTTETTPQPTTNACPYTNMNTQFRTGTEAWVDGTAMTAKNLKVNDTIAINCFVNSGSAVMNPADVTVNGTAVKSNSVGSVDAYTLAAAGTYSVVCKDSQNRPNCSDTDSFTIAAATITTAPTATNTVAPTLTHTPIPTSTYTPTPTATNTPTPTATLTPKPTNSPTPVPTNTPVPPPTLTPTPTQTVIVLVNTPTPTPVTQLVVNEQAPGFNPWFALLIPFGLVILGLAL